MRLTLAALAVFAGCARPDDRSTSGAIDQFVSAAGRGDSDRVVEMLDASTIERLRARAREASDLAGGGVNLGPADVLAVGFEPARLRPARVETTSRRGADATVRLHGADGATVTVKLRSEHGRWKIVLAP
jgi:hypothetical protein